MDISIIVPLYKGEKYILQILNQINACSMFAVNSRIEVILFNDYPEQIIEVDEEDYPFDIYVVNSKINRGIHGARVEALKYANKEYVLFLDQDDLISPEYIKSQIDSIQDSDAVVCRLINNKRMHYTDTFVFEEVISKEFMINNWCSIVSPGQVVIRKSAIPDIWKSNILTNNGADDYFLWISMMCLGCKFALNQEVLFEHVHTGENTSEDTNKMMNSEDEMIGILKRTKILGECGEDIFNKLSISLRKIHIRQLDEQRNAYQLLVRLYRDYFCKGYIYEFIKENSNKNIAVYGAGELGVKLKQFFELCGLGIECFIDRNSKYIISDIPVYSCDDIREYDIIVLSINNDSLYEKLKEDFKCEVVKAQLL